MRGRGPGLGSNPATSVRERLETGETRLLLSASESSGEITAARVSSEGWASAPTDLHIETGELVVTTDATGGITIQRFGMSLLPIEISRNVIARPTQLDHVRAEIQRPVKLDARWTGGDQATVHAELALVLSWMLNVDGAPLPLGAPELPPVPIDLEFTGDGSVVHAQLTATVAGAIWTWADLVKLEDLSLTLAAHTP